MHIVPASAQCNALWKPLSRNSPVLKLRGNEASSLLVITIQSRQPTIQTKREKKLGLTQLATVQGSKVKSAQCRTLPMHNPLG